MKFVEYSSIENSYRDREIAAIRNSGFDTVEWVATEKVHGTNFGLWPIDGQVRPSQRSGFSDGSFYGCQSVVESLAEKVLKIGFPIYGELFGKGIQKGVDYGEKRFAAFDILMGEEYADYYTFVSLCDTHGIDRCVEIARGSFDELLAIDPSFTTKMGVEGCIDTAEGFVMKPVTPLRFGHGGRVILKKKSPGFSEKATGPKPKVVVEFTPAQQELFDAASGYVTEGRLACVLSKFGEDPKFQEVLGAFLKDISDEVAKDSTVDPSTWGSIHKQLSSVVAPLIRKSLFGS